VLNKLLFEQEPFKYKYLPQRAQTTKHKFWVSRIFIGRNYKNCNVFFLDSLLLIITLSCYFRVHRPGSQLIKKSLEVWCFLAGNQLYDWQTHRMMRLSKKTIDIFNFKQRLLSIDMKTKVVLHVPRIIFNVFKVFRFPAPVWLTDIFILFKFMK